MKNTWGIKEMLEYAINKYHLSTKTDYNGNCKKSSYEKAIRRKLQSEHLVKKDEQTGNYTYRLPEDSARYFIDNMMKETFSDNKKYDDEIAKQAFSKNDNKLNEKHFREFVEEADYISKCYEDGIDPYNVEPVVTYDEIEKAILKMMIRAIFNQYFEFEEDKYIKDYIELKKLVNYDDFNEPYREGYSYLKNKIENPIDNYCIKK